MLSRAVLQFYKFARFDPRGAPFDDKELADQEKRLVTLMKEVEPTLNEAQHGQVTKLLCELTAYNVMQTLNSLQSARPKTTFRG